MCVMAYAVSISMSRDVSILEVIIGLVFEEVVLVVVLCSVVLRVDSLILRVNGVCVVLRRFGKCES